LWRISIKDILFARAIRLFMCINLTPLIASFSFIFLAELGDKTQLCTLMLSSRFSALSVFLGAMAAFFLVDGVSALLGGEILSLLPSNIISLIAGIIFIVFGLISLVRRRSVEETSLFDIKVSFFRAFSLTALMELGDKTQIASILLAAQFGDPVIVLAGVMLAFSLLTGISVVLGYKVLRLLPRKYLNVAVSLAFIIVGLLILLGQM
jgi:putative Ca2+/H+ antiporter (TMEM165/GDT1 family)